MSIYFSCIGLGWVNLDNTYGEIMEVCSGF